MSEWQVIDDPLCPDDQGWHSQLVSQDPEWTCCNEAEYELLIAAAVARKVYLRQDLGVGALRKQFGGRNKRKGTVPEHFAKAAGGLIRHILQQLEDLQLVEKSTTQKGGRYKLPHTMHIRYSSAW